MNTALVILGGCGGIGRSVTSGARDAGYDVVVLDLPRSLDAHPPPAGVAAYPVDATNSEQLAEAASAIRERHQNIRGFVNTSGFMADKAPIVETDSAAWNEVVSGNLTSAFLSARQFAPMIMAGGSLVLTGSGLGARARPDYGPYAVSKAGIAMLTKQLALELAPDVRANCVAPSAVNTAFLRGGTGRSNERADARVDTAAFAANVPLRRLAEPDDIAGPILFLLSDAAKYITGQVLYVNGGAYMP